MFLFCVCAHEHLCLLLKRVELGVQVARVCSVQHVGPGNSSQRVGTWPFAMLLDLRCDFVQFLFFNL